jgi:hypothetical protein
MEQLVFCIFIDYRWNHRKGVTISTVNYVNFHQNLGFNEKICIFEHYREVQAIQNQLIGIDLAMKIFFLMTSIDLY